MLRSYKGLQGLSILALSALISSASLAQTGVSDDRVSLPEGPGSLEGVGDNTGINTSMGLMTHSVSVEVPAGFGSVTPSVGLSYSSGGGSGVLGMGWSMPMPAIERMTYRGLPEYDSGDDFCANGSEQLVRLPGTSPAVYRARFEGGFVRYTWLEEGEGAEGYWLAEYPDGTRAYFGATAEGVLVPTARVTGEEGTFRYHLVEKVDVFGHRAVWRYRKSGLYSLPVGIGYVFKEGEPTYEVDFAYEERSDEDGLDLISDAMPGFDLLLSERLRRIEVKSRGVVIRAYRLTYVPFARSGGISLLGKVEREGVEGGIYPVIDSFEYSQNLGGEDNVPFMMDMGSVQASFTARTSQLIDINGDALPDIVDASQSGFHRFFLNIAGTDGTSRFEPTPRLSEVGTRASHNLSQGTVQVLDVNGDGFTDLINAATGQVLINKGGGDWDEAASGQGTSSIAAALSEDFDPDEGGLQSLRFIDFNNDKRIDLMRSTLFETSFFANMGEAGFEVVEAPVTLGAGFVENNLELSDMNGDGLLDVVQLQVGALRYRLNMGRGMWSDWVDISGLSLDQAQVEFASLEDINGDALADIVVVVGNTVSFALNDNSSSFDGLIELESGDVEGNIPLRDSNTTVLFADMNGNGSSDIVWIQPGGQIDALELFPLRPNLMTKITNNIGSVTEIQYETAAQQMARDGGWEAWRHKLPYPMNMVARLDKFDLLTDVHEITTYSYHDGFYDGEEKQFRGFERVETQLVGDEAMEDGLTVQAFDMGATDTYRHGLLLSTEVFSGGRALDLTTMTYEDCEVAEVPEGTLLPVRHLCNTATSTVHKEGQPESAWIRVGSDYQYDGYGNITLRSELGVTHRGGGVCEPCEGRDAEAFGVPCGAGCVGDEFYTEAQFTPTTHTGGRWIISAPFRQRSYGRQGSDKVKERLIYYDGESFEGLPLGNLTLGRITRVTEKRDVGSDDVIAVERFAYDDHGNVIDDLDPLGSPEGHTHRRQITYDAENLRPRVVEILLEDADGEPYRLRREVTYEPLFDQAQESTAWVRVVDGQVRSTRRAVGFSYDEFGRLTERYLPGGLSEAPDVVYEYELDNPTSRIITRQRSEVGGDFDIESINCLDGRGRTFQKRIKLSPNRYQITGWSRFNVRSAPVEIFQPYQSTSGQCDLAPPEGTLSVRFLYDASGRELQVTKPDAELYGTSSVLERTYLPLVREFHDEEDTDPDSPHFNTPQTITTDGLGRVVAVDRRLQASGAVRVSMHYDSLGRPTGYEDPGGHVKTQTYDLLDRVTSVLDPNAEGELTFEYDDASNLVLKTDGRGVSTRFEYEGDNRVTALYDPSDRAGTLIARRHDFDPDCASLDCTNTEGQVASVSYPGLEGVRITEQAGYDLRGRLSLMTRDFGGFRFEFAPVYDNADRLIAMAWPDGRVTERRYDSASRLVEVSDLIHTIGYDERGLLGSMGCADGASTSMSHDKRMRLAGISTSFESEDPLQSFTYQRDRSGNILSVEDLAEPAPGRPSFALTSTYDAWYRAVEVRFGDQSGGEEARGFSFDELGNLRGQASSLAGGLGSLSYESASPNAVTAFDGRSYDYDSAGHMVQRGEQTMTWDHLGRMTHVEQGGDEVARFVYGADQSRVARREEGSVTLYASKDFVVRDGISSLYVTVNGRRALRIDSDALATRLLPDLAEDGQINAADARVAHETDAGIEPERLLWSSVRRLMVETGPDDGVTFLHSDHLGSLTLATGSVDGAPTVLGQRAYYPLGTERPGGSGYVDEYGFTGQEIDRSTGLIHFDWRYYDPHLGRWLSIDPLFAIASASSAEKIADATGAYAYVSGDFINATDPTGLETTKVKAQSRVKALQKHKKVLQERIAFRQKRLKVIDKVISKAVKKANDYKAKHGHKFGLAARWVVHSPAIPGVQAGKPDVIHDIPNTSLSKHMTLKREVMDAKNFKTNAPKEIETMKNDIANIEHDIALLERDHSVVKERLQRTLHRKNSNAMIQGPGNSKVRAGDIKLRYWGEGL